MAPFKNRVYNNNPKAQMPIQSIISLSDGKYWTKSPRVEGIKPGTTKPSPFSIQMPITIMMQEKIRANDLCRAGDKRIMAASTFIASEVQIHGVSKLAPCSPKS